VARLNEELKRINRIPRDVRRVPVLMHRLEQLGEIRPSQLNRLTG
jgi:hypothetical protein